MDLILEIILTFIIEGTVEVISEKKIPVFFRVIAAVVLLVLYIGAGGMLIYIGIENNSRIIIGVAVVLLILVAVVTVRKCREIYTDSQ